MFVYIAKREIDREKSIITQLLKMRHLSPDAQPRLTESQFSIEKIDTLYLEQVPQVISMNRQVREALM